MQIQGQVQEIQARDTKAGVMYDLIVNGDKYGIGKYAPRDIRGGDFVTFVMEQNGNFRNVARGTLRKTEGQAVAQAAAPSAPTKQSVGGGWDERQATISKQAALNTAISLVEIAFAAGAINLGSKANEKYGILERIVYEQAARFHEFSTGHAVEIPEPTPATKSRGAKPAVEESPPDSEWND